jgi:hypothetical protein
MSDLIPVAYKISPATKQTISRLAGRWSAPAVGVVSHAVDLIGDADLAATLGGQFQSAEQAMHCWAAVITQATAELDFAREEWNLIADANNGCSPLLTMAGEDIRPHFPPMLLWANVADDIRLNGGDKKWRVKKPDSLVERLRDLDFAHAWAVILAAQWFWEHAACDIDHSKDAWWTVDFRRAHKCAEEK